MVGRSKVWRLARFTDDTRVEVECSLCPVKIKYVGNTTNIARHLELRHPIEFAALDPLAGPRGRSGGVTTRQQHQHYLRQPQQQREEAAICRILAQHQEELRRQESSSSTTITPNIKVPNVIMPTKVWTWHIPVQGECECDSFVFFFCMMMQHTVTIRSGL